LCRWFLMKVSVYSSEKFERGPLWYVIFSSVVVGVLLLSLFNDNIVGAILLFFLLGGYFYYTVSSNHSIDAVVETSGLRLGKQLHPWNALRGYVLEIDKNTQLIKNIVFLFPKYHLIHTFEDEKDEIKTFILALNDYLPMLSEYEQSFLQKLTRVIKL